jgi:hypothetical protein
MAESLRAVFQKFIYASPASPSKSNYFEELRLVMSGTVRNANQLLPSSFGQFEQIIDTKAWW